MKRYVTKEKIDSALQAEANSLRFSQTKLIERVRNKRAGFTQQKMFGAEVSFLALN